MHQTRRTLEKPLGKGKMSRDRGKDRLSSDDGDWEEDGWVVMEHDVYAKWVSAVV